MRGLHFRKNRKRFHKFTQTFAAENEGKPGKIKHFGDCSSIVLRGKMLRKLRKRDKISFVLSNDFWAIPKENEVGHYVV